MKDISISVRNLSKRYRLGVRQETDKTFVGQLVNTIKSPVRNLKKLSRLSDFSDDDKSIFWALRDVGFDVRSGEVLGIIGHNGAGKSTLLKILSRITEPTSGEVRITGRVSSLLEVGTGFHPELTGRENIYMNGTLLGMRKREIDAKLDEIIAFSGVDAHIDTPVKFYSSGMKVRLGFSVAAHLEPEILIIDEVLAVGDFDFQSKCLGKMESVSRSEGRTVLFVSHNMAAIQTLCHRAVLLRKGHMEYQGQVADVVGKYMSSYKTESLEELDHTLVKGNKDIVITSVKFYCNDNSEEAAVLLSGAEVNVVLNYRCERPETARNVRVAFAVSSVNGNESFACDNFYLGKKFDQIKEEGVFRLTIKKWPLNKGIYKYRIHIENNGSLAFRLEEAGELKVEFGDFFRSGFVVPAHLNGALIDHEWNII